MNFRPFKCERYDIDFTRNIIIKRNKMIYKKRKTTSLSNLHEKSFNKTFYDLFNKRAKFKIDKKNKTYNSKFKKIKDDEFYNLFISFKEGSVNEFINMNFKNVVMKYHDLNNEKFKNDTFQLIKLHNNALNQNNTYLISIIKFRQYNNLKRPLKNEKNLKHIQKKQKYIKFNVK